MHAFRGKRTLLGALHTSIKVALPPLVQRGCATGAKRRACQRGGQEKVVHRSLPAHQESDQRGKEDQERKPRFDQFGKVTDQCLKARSGDCGGFHAMRSIKLAFGASGKTKSRVRAPQKSRKVIRAPTSKERAPSAMWAVATSAALFDQIVQAPSPICARIIAIQIIDQNLTARVPRLAFQKNASTAAAISSSQERDGPSESRFARHSFSSRRRPAVPH